MGNQTVFSLDVRVTACGQCGAPLVVQAAGGLLPCKYCGNEQQLMGSTRAVTRAAVLPEPQRMAALWSQDARPVSVPPDLVGLMPVGELLPWKAAEAMRRWKSAHAAAGTSDSPAEGERLCWLTLGLADHFEKSGELLRERAVLEGALEVLSLPRHCQLICAALSRCACRAADMAAAEAWLATCDPTPTDLEADSAYRFACACLETMRGRFDGVLAVLGSSPAQVPIATLYDAECAVLRANALERTGQTSAAVQLLEHFKQSAGGLQRLLAERFIDRHRAWALCTRSDPQSEVRQRSLGGHAAAEAAGKPTVLTLIALALFGGGIAVTIVLFALRLMVVDAIGFAGWMGVGFLTLAIDNLRKARHARQLRIEGTRAMAQVIDGRPTGTVTMGVPEIEFKLLVFAPSGSVHRACCTIHADAKKQAQLLPGSVVAVRFVPQEPHVAQIEID